MNIVDFAFEDMKRSRLIRALEKNIKEANTIAHNTEHAAEPIIFSKENGPIVIMRLKESEHELRFFPVRKFLYEWGKSILNDGQSCLSKEDLFLKIQSLDENENIRMSEFFRIKDILIEQSSEIFLLLIKKALYIQTKREKAEKWASDSGSAMNDDDVFFLEHAIKLIRDSEDENKHPELMKQLELSGKTEEHIVEKASEKISNLLLRLSNAVSVIHLVKNIDWHKAFMEISYTERALSKDPGKIYPTMDNESKDAIRREVSYLAEISHLSEMTIAKAACELVNSLSYKDITQVIYTDPGRKALLNYLNVYVKHIQKMTPDEKGIKLITTQMLLTALSFLVTSIEFPFAVSILLIPGDWMLSQQLIRFLASKFVKTHPLLSIHFPQIPDVAKTLVVIPALLTSEAGVRSITNRLAEHGVHEDDPNIDFLLLGDFKDCEEKEHVSDIAVMNAAFEEIEKLNTECSRKKYFYLQRERIYCKSDDQWRGRERKRGAIEDLNRLIVNGENRFMRDCRDAEGLKHKYSFILTADSDTRILPGEIKRMIGMIAHPLNQQYGVIQPRMENMIGEKRNILSSYLAGSGGMDHYDICASDLYQDLTGEGLFTGKGILNIKVFFEKCSEAFQENTVLSHDMIEGILSKAAYAGNRVMFESFPTTVAGYLKRLDRWTRGDWQLIYYAFGRIKLDPLGRFKIISNLLRSLTGFSVLLGIAASFWYEKLGILLFSIFIHFLPVFLSGTGAIRPAIMSFALLPSTAWTEIKACFTAIARLYVTKKKRLEWVTAAESNESNTNIIYPGMVSAIFLIPGLFSSHTAILALVTGVIFSFSAPFIEWVQKAYREDALSSSEYGYLSELASAIWKYFEKYVPVNGNGVPPDNVQVDPPVGVQPRTSPTNIGMYILSVLSAHELGLIEQEEMCDRLKSTADSLRQMETMKGLFYNWYDSKTLKPVYPKYVSSVDLGNLMAACVTVRNAIRENCPELSKMYQEIISNMDISFLFDENRKLFAIGYDAESHQMSASHYDLYSSESRILSYVSIAEKNMSLSHWKHLARPFSWYGNKPVLLSWSGTMFEYMMPSLVLPSGYESLAQKTMKRVVSLQIKQKNGGIWGISESCYKAIDRNLNYQYHAFGINALSLSGEETGRVYAPYAAILALEYAREHTLEALSAMQEAGMRGDYAFYEAIDMTKADNAQIVYSYMSHHQGMSFVALSNALTNYAIRRHFMSDPRESSLWPLLSEKPIHMPIRKILFSRPNDDFLTAQADVNTHKTGDFSRTGNKRFRDGHILFAGDVSAFFDPDGRSFLKRKNIFLNAWSGDSEYCHDSILPSITVENERAEIRNATFDTGFAEYEMHSAHMDTVLCATISPETGHLLIQAKMTNNSNKKLGVLVRCEFKLALNTQDAYLSHPIFSDLFLEKEKVSENTYIIKRKNRENLSHDLFACVLADGRTEEEENTNSYMDKRINLYKYVSLKPYETEFVYFEYGIEKSFLSDYPIPCKDSFERACILLRAQMNAHIRFCNLKSFEYKAIDRLTANIVLSRPRNTGEAVSAESLWPLGLSGEKPILLVRVNQKSNLENVRRMVRVREFLRYCGFELTLVIIKIRETEYFTPLSDSIRTILFSAHLEENESGAIVLEKDAISQLQLDTLKAISVCFVKNDFLKDSVPERKEIKYTEFFERIELEEQKHDEKFLLFNGYGGFRSGECAYEILVNKNQAAPRRWSNLLANAHFGALTNDAGIGCLYYKNSRTGRITPFDNSIQNTINAVDFTASENGKHFSILPTDTPEGAYNIIIKPGETVYKAESKNAIYVTTCFVDAEKPVFYSMIEISQKTESPLKIELSASVRFLMGCDVRDLKYTKVDELDSITIAGGKAEFCAYATFLDEKGKPIGMKAQYDLKGNTFIRTAFVIGASDEPQVKESIPFIDPVASLYKSRKAIKSIVKTIEADTKNIVRDQIVNGFLKAQTLFSRFYARFGPYQPGGAFGMRDQLQDLLSIMYFDPKIARDHILLCASRQFQEGDALHWWHMPASGVRTRVSDDILFLAYVTAKYIDLTGDAEILNIPVPYLKAIEIPNNAEDIYASFEETEEKAPLYDHIVKALRYVNTRGKHSLLLMGAGDWNDGMNRVGHRGRGESVWLSEFWVCAASEFITFAKETDKEYLTKEIISIKEAIEKHAWDGEWYIRAFDDDGKKIGAKDSKECKIDLISQAWAVMAGLDKERVSKAIQSAEKYLVDRSIGIIKLLAPPFTGVYSNPGYISAYPPGIRENGGQYTHGALWLVKAYSILNMADEAWSAFDMLLPISHTDTKEKACQYGGEPYVIAADIASHKDHYGSCGWTWYTGAAAWAERIIIEDLLGVQIKGNKARMKALLPSGIKEMKCTVRRGESEHILISRRGITNDMGDIKLKNDGKTHEYVFPPRNP